MRTALLPAVVLGLAALVLCTPDASAMYHPATGAWLERDPGVESPMRPGASPAEAFNPQAPTADGPNLYQYVRSDPVQAQDPQGLFGPLEHTAITLAGWGMTRLRFAAGTPLIGPTYLEDMIFQNVNTDLVHPKDPTYHAQAIGFVGRVLTRMNNLKTRRCWTNWAWTSGDWATINDMGTTLHILQDIYAHTDWVDGTNMNAVYAAYGDRRVASVNAPSAGTVSLKNLEAGNPAEFLRTVFYTGGGLGGVAGDLHDRYAADSTTQGRARNNNPAGGVFGLGPAAYNRAAAQAAITTKDFIIWAKNNMTKCCCEILFGKGSCNRNRP